MCTITREPTGNDRHCLDSEKVYTDNVDPRFVHGPVDSSRNASSAEEKGTWSNYAQVELLDARTCGTSGFQHFRNQDAQQEYSRRHISALIGYRAPVRVCVCARARVCGACVRACACCVSCLWRVRARNVFVCVRVWRMRACRVRVRCVCALFTGARSWRAVVDSSLSSSSSTSLSSSSSSSSRSRARFAAACLTSIEGLAGAEEEREEPPPWPTVPLAELEHLPSPFPSPHATPSPPRDALPRARWNASHRQPARHEREKGRNVRTRANPDHPRSRGALGRVRRATATGCSDSVSLTHHVTRGSSFIVARTASRRTRIPRSCPSSSSRASSTSGTTWRRSVQSNPREESRLRLDYVINDEGYRAPVAWIARDLHYRRLRENATRCGTWSPSETETFESRAWEIRVSAAEEGKGFS